MPSTSSSPSPDKQRSTQLPARDLAALVVEAMQSKKAVDVAVIDVRDVSGVTDFFVVCTGESSIQVKAIADAVREHVRDEADERPWKREGTQHNQWVLLDYVDVVAHVFDRERRAYYDLERLWGDAPVEHVADDATEVAILQEEE